MYRVKYKMEEKKGQGVFLILKGISIMVNGWKTKNVG